MSRDSGAEQPGQRTVAELLAQYGGAAPRNGPRRRRRAEDPSDTAPQEIIDRVNAESGPLRAVPPAVAPPHAPQVPSRSAVRGHVAPAPPHPAPASQEPAADRSEHAAHDHWTRRFAAVDQPAGAPTRPADPNGAPPALDDVEATAQQPMPVIRPQSPLARRPAVPDGRTRQGSTDAEPMTEQFSPFRAQQAPDPPETALPAASGSFPALPPASPAATELSEADDSHRNERVDTGAEEAEPKGHARSVPVGAQDEPEPAEDGGRTTREWIVLASQVGAGLLGGAGLYEGSRWLWQSIPLVAVAAAVVVTGCLVFLVRRSSRTDDLQTVVLAVLVGLACTVSPVAVMLLSR